MQYSPYYSEIKKILFDWGHRDVFLYTKSEAIDTMFFNYLEGVKNIPESFQSMKETIARNAVRELLYNFIIPHRKNGASEDWAKTVVGCAIYSLQIISKYDSSIEVLYSAFKYLVVDLKILSE